MGQAFLQRGRGAVSTVTTSAPAASDRSSSTRAAASGGFVNELGTEMGDVMAGRLSLIALNTMVLGLVVFYIWTRQAQGGG